MVRTLPFHGKNTGSNPVRDVFLKIINENQKKSITKKIKKFYN